MHLTYSRCLANSAVLMLVFGVTITTVLTTGCRSSRLYERDPNSMYAGDEFFPNLLFYNGQIGHDLQADEYGNHLRALGMTSFQYYLWENADTERAHVRSGPDADRLRLPEYYRLLIQPSFEEPSVIFIQVSADGIAMLTARQANEKDSADVGGFSESVKTLTPEEVDKIRMLVRDSQNAAIRKPYDGVRILDPLDSVGWLFEAVIDDKYVVMNRVGHPSAYEVKDGVYPLWKWLGENTSRQILPPGWERMNEEEQINALPEALVKEYAFSDPKLRPEDFRDYIESATSFFRLVRGMIAVAPRLRQPKRGNLFDYED